MYNVLDKGIGWTYTRETAIFTQQIKWNDCEPLFGYAFKINIWTQKVCASMDSNAALLHFKDGLYLEHARQSQSKTFW